METLSRFFLTVLFPLNREVTVQSGAWFSSLGQVPAGQQLRLWAALPPGLWGRLGCPETWAGGKVEERGSPTVPGVERARLEQRGPLARPPPAAVLAAGAQCTDTSPAVCLPHGSALEAASRLGLQSQSQTRPFWSGGTQGPRSAVIPLGLRGKGQLPNTCPRIGSGAERVSAAEFPVVVVVRR